MDTKKENLRELIEKFMDPRNAQMYLDDIEAGERILRKYPAPKPDDMLLANIKANIALHIIPQKTLTFRKRVLEAIAVAASLIIIAAISLQSIDETPTLPPNVPTNISIVVPLPPGFWTQENPVISELNNVVDEIKSQIVKIAMDSPDYSYDSIPFDQYNKEIQQLEKRLYNVGSNHDEYTYNNSIFENIEDLKNQLDELNNNFWQDEYSNPDAFEI